MISNNVMREFGAYRNYRSICSGYFKKKWSKNMNIFAEIQPAKIKRKIT